MVKVKLKKTSSFWVTLSNENKKLCKFVSHESKNIFNHYLFCSKIFLKYKNKFYHCNDDTKFLNKLTKKFELHSKYFKELAGNSKIVYDMLKNKHICVLNDNFEKLLKKYGGIEKSIKYIEEKHSGNPARLRMQQMLRLSFFNAVDKKIEQLQS